MDKRIQIMMGAQSNDYDDDGSKEKDLHRIRMEEYRK